MRILAPLMLLLLVSNTVMADFVTLLPANSRNVPDDKSLVTLADTFGKSVTVRYLDEDFGRSGNLNPSDSFVSQSSNVGDKLFGFELNASHQAGCDFPESFDSNQLAMAGELPVAASMGADETQLAQSDDFSWLYNSAKPSEMLEEGEAALASASAFDGTEDGLVLGSDEAMSLELASRNKNDLFAADAITQSSIDALMAGSRTSSLLAGELGTIPGSLDLILAVGSGGAGGGAGGVMREAEVPEPSTVVMMLIGILGGMFYRKRILAGRKA